MNISESLTRKLDRLNNALELRFGLRLDFDDVEHLSEVYKHYWFKREQILREHGEIGTLSNRDYAKAVLISETIHLLLREIAPKRLKKRKKSK